MSGKFIPEHIDPFRYAEQGLALAGTLKISDMPRLCGNVLLSDGGIDSDGGRDKVEVELQFGVDEQGVPFLKGHLTARPVLQCQRCMEPFTYEIMSDFVLGIVNTLDEADELPKHYEPALTVEGSLALKELIEDEVILNLPIVPKHRDHDCKVKLPFAVAQGEQEKGKNPFHVLQHLRPNRGNKE